MAITIVVITATKKTVIKINAEENNFNATTRNVFRSIGNAIMTMIAGIIVTKLTAQALSAIPILSLDVTMANASTRNGNVIWRRIAKTEVTKLIVQKGQLLAR